jgi:uncharacterized protein (TIGR00661 family)
MKILYAVQATGNGHISRAMELLPYLKRYGKVDLFLSGANSSLDLDAPVRYRSKGLCLFYNSIGSLNYFKMVREFAPLRVLREARDLPVEKYDLVLNDFECITALACWRKRIPSINFGHQASFQSEKTPRPSPKDAIGEWILRHYGRASQYIGLHFQSYDDFILPPVIKKSILQAEPSDQGHICVYLPSYSDEELYKFLSPLTNHPFQVFSKQVSQPTQRGQILFLPVHRKAFDQSLITSHAVLTGAGFETPAEALYLGKKLLTIPIQGQYEQLCNAAALEKMGVPVVNRLDQYFARSFNQWMADQKRVSLSLDYSTEAIIRFVMEHSQPGRFKSWDLEHFGGLTFN